MLSSDQDREVFFVRKMADDIEEAVSAGEDDTGDSVFLSANSLMPYFVHRQVRQSITSKITVQRECMKLGFGQCEEFHSSLRSAFLKTLYSKPCTC